MKKALLFVTLLIVLGFTTTANAAEYRVYMTSLGDGIVVFAKITEGEVGGILAGTPPSGETATEWGLTVWELPANPWFYKTGTAEINGGWTWFKTTPPNGIALAALTTAKTTPFVRFPSADVDVTTSSVTLYLNNEEEAVMPDGNFPLHVAGMTPLVSPVIDTQPQSVTVSVGEQVQLAVACHSETPGSVSYQWKKDGTDVAGATDSQLIFTSAETFDAGEYACVVSDPIGSVTSATATITVNGTIPNTTASATVSFGKGLTITLNVNGNVADIFPGITSPGQIKQLGALFTVWSDAEQRFVEKLVTQKVQIASWPTSFTIIPPEWLSQQMALVAVGPGGSVVMADMTKIHGRTIGNAFVASMDPIPVNSAGYWEFPAPTESLPATVPIGLAIIGLAIATIARRRLA